MKKILFAITILLVFAITSHAAVVIKLKGDTAANWTANNPVLALREPGVETDTSKIKIGDGTTAWNSLPYISADISETDPLFSAWNKSYLDLIDTPSIPADVGDLTDTGGLLDSPPGPVVLQQAFMSATTLVADTGSKILTPTGIDFTLGHVGCDVIDTLTVSLKSAPTVMGSYTEVGNIVLTDVSLREDVDISAWADVAAGTWLRIDLEGTPGAASECTIAIEGVEL